MRQQVSYIIALMSGASGNPSQRRGSFASRKARGEQGGATARSGKEKAHGFDARYYHQNANRHGIHTLRTFDCPVCDSKSTIRVDLNPRLREGTVRCTYCMSLRPIPEDLPYPYSAPFIPSLENKADVFFKFNEMYTALLQRQTEGDDAAGPSSSSAVEGHGGGGGARKRPRDGDDAGDDVGGVGEAGADGLFSELEFYPADPDAPDNVLHGVSEEAALGEARVDDHSVGEDGEGDMKEAEVAVEESEAHAAHRPPQADVGDDLSGTGVDDVDIADFFADSD
ncbi:hypothetical protein ABL78_4225 [Leptomonas seymouri]|uniref:Transcription elongation factor 1 homolog n=1 Tax=Leptomonas seymouri TaxID=5684 RepID=A0A0N0P5P6_LEPSE|nr:hypothetical protein ABL78_4225 [Leptomonas seymouri]|eukprot:KPI86709.1 hypothetical protein ABL78_4225 [Leptomonas seymouri]